MPPSRDSSGARRAITAASAESFWACSLVSCSTSAACGSGPSASARRAARPASSAAAAAAWALSSASRREVSPSKSPRASAALPICSRVFILARSWSRPASAVSSVAFLSRMSPRSWAAIACSRSSAAPAPSSFAASSACTASIAAMRPSTRRATGSRPGSRPGWGPASAAAPARRAFRRFRAAKPEAMRKRPRPASESTIVAMGSMARVRSWLCDPGAISSAEMVRAPLMSGSP